MCNGTRVVFSCGHDHELGVTEATICWQAKAKNYGSCVGPPKGFTTLNVPLKCPDKCMFKTVKEDLRGLYPPGRKERFYALQQVLVEIEVVKTLAQAEMDKQKDMSLTRPPPKPQTGNAAPGKSSLKAETGNTAPGQSSPTPAKAPSQ